jgi:hypothetical protein
MQQFRQIRRAIQEQDALDEHFGVLHLVDGLLLDVARQLLVFPVFAHLRMKEVLADCRQFLFESGVQFGNDFRISTHGRIVIQLQLHAQGQPVRPKPASIRHP